MKLLYPYLFTFARNGLNKSDVGNVQESPPDTLIGSFLLICDVIFWKANSRNISLRQYSNKSTF
jgi:hypothetical protein